MMCFYQPEIEWIEYLNRKRRTYLEKNICLLTNIDEYIVRLAISIVKDIMTLNDIRPFLQMCPAFGILLEEYSIKQIPNNLKNVMRKEFGIAKLIHYKILSILITLLNTALDGKINNETDADEIVYYIYTSKQKPLIQVMEMLSKLPQ